MNIHRLPMTHPFRVHYDQHSRTMPLEQCSINICRRAVRDGYRTLTLNTLIQAREVEFDHKIISDEQGAVEYAVTIHDWPNRTVPPGKYSGKLSDVTINELGVVQIRVIVDPKDKIA